MTEDSITIDDALEIMFGGKVHYGGEDGEEGFSFSDKCPECSGVVEPHEEMQTWQDCDDWLVAEAFGECPKCGPVNLDFTGTFGVSV